MKTIGALGVVLGGAMIIGCASGTPRASTPGANTPAGAYEVAQEQLARSVVATTTLTSAPVTSPGRLRLMPADEVYAPAAAAAAPTRTWGATPSEQDSADDDLAQNPYLEKRDIYDPR